MTSSSASATLPSKISLEATYEFKTTACSALTPELLARCSKLYNENYGIWGPKAGLMEAHCIPGKRVHLSPAREAQEILSAPESSVLATCVEKETGTLVGHAFATVWKYDGGIVGWVTQLVVEVSHRRRGIATQLIQTFKTHPLFQNITAVGLASSHPASVRALTKYNDVSLDKVDLDFIAKNAEAIFAATPVKYLKPKEKGLLRGSLFEKGCQTGAVSSVFTEFYVDHGEPLEVLDAFKKRGAWPLGKLLEGHEFLIIVPVKKS